MSASLLDSPAIRLLNGDSMLRSRAAMRPSLYRPWTLGTAIVVRPPDSPRFEVEVIDDGTLLPRILHHDRETVSRLTRYRSRGLCCRAAATLVVPGDATSPLLHRPADAVATPPIGRRDAAPPHLRPRRGARRRPIRRALEMYGWSLMYQPVGVRGVAYIDRHEAFDDLPAYFELPQELLDRAAFLAARGIASRPLALVTAVSDFVRLPDGCRRNRFIATARFHAAVAG